MVLISTKLISMVPILLGPICRERTYEEPIYERRTYAMPIFGVPI